MDLSEQLATASQDNPQSIADVYLLPQFQQLAFVLLLSRELMRQSSSCIRSYDCVECDIVN